MREIREAVRPEIDRRCFPTVVRVDAEKRILVGHAAVFNQITDLGWFLEQIDPHAFDAALADDVRALFNHDPNLVLGRRPAGTLRLRIDATGLQYEIDVPDTSYGRDLLVSVSRGDVSQSSFQFAVVREAWDNDRNLRTILEVRPLYDVSPVTFPAYVGTDVSARSKVQAKENILRHSEALRWRLLEAERQAAR